MRSGAVGQEPDGAGGRTHSQLSQLYILVQFDWLSEVSERQSYGKWQGTSSSTSSSTDAGHILLLLLLQKIQGFVLRRCKGLHTDTGMLLSSWQPRVWACTNCAWRTASGQRQGEKKRKTPLRSHFHTHRRTQYLCEHQKHTCLLQALTVCILLWMVTLGSRARTHARGPAPRQWFQLLNINEPE